MRCTSYVVVDVTAAVYDVSTPRVNVVSLSWTEIVAKSSSSYSFLIVLDYVYRFTHDVKKSFIVNCSIQQQLSGN